MTHQIYTFSSTTDFPALEHANEDGLLAMGGDLEPDTLVCAYHNGIFPWFSDGQPILWWSPNPRLVIFPDHVSVSRSMRKLFNRSAFRVTMNLNFDKVIDNCANRRPIDSSIKLDTASAHAHSSTWITNSMKSAYTQLHKLGVAHSIEVWQGDSLVGGLYGLALNHAFFGESMFSHVPNASKYALISLCRFLVKQNFTVIDCQVENNHLLSLGAQSIERQYFLELIDAQSDKVQIHPNLGQEFNK